jgi:anti-sigma regulatory factor (Ser/Thr protein kinase)
MAMVDEVRLQLPANVGAVRDARQALAALDGPVDDVFDTARLVVSELVTNSLLHDDLGPRDTISLLLKLEDGYLRIEVGDRGGFIKRAEDPWAPQATELGLCIVDAVSESWQARDGRVTAWLAI